LNKKLRIALIAAGVAMIPVLISPLPSFKDPLSTVVEASDGSLLGARIADDGQWRFPGPEKVPDKFEKALLTFEDKWFYYHPGINPVAIIRAFKDNVRAGEVVSGGSTVTMQVARISRGNRPRTYKEKIIEIFSALKLELFRSKRKILGMYASNAPFGGNTVGLETAAWRYTGKSPDDITWAEAATLAILPNSPSLIFPGKNQDLLLKRRNTLLRKLYERKYIDSVTLVLAVDEPLMAEPKPLPSLANHLTDYYYKSAKGTITLTTISAGLQERATAVLNEHMKELEQNFIYNSCCMIVEVETGNVLAYVGNSTLEDAHLHGGDVDIIRSLRSTGSILKPILYAGMQQSGDILPNSLVPDIPTRFPGFSPKNFDHTFSGAVSASTALSQSLNIPAVKMLQKYNPARFLELLHRTGFTSFDKTADYYGLSLILGGGEASLWELTGVYASLSRVLNNNLKGFVYSTTDYHPPVLVASLPDSVRQPDREPPLSASAIWLTYEALLKVNRPETESGWQYFSSSAGLAWKTGTSFGFRDAWAIGTTPRYVVGVWAGNATGEGRPGLTGISAAAPLMFDLVNLLQNGPWFEIPDRDLTMISVCRESGFRAGRDCKETIDIPANLNGLRSDICPYHTMVHLNKERTRQVSTKCYAPEDIVNEAWFILPPAMEYFYRKNHAEYRPLPQVAEGCTTDKNIPVMEFIYPTAGIKIFIPRDNTGELARVVAEIVHRIPAKTVYWHLDDRYLKATRMIHQIDIYASPGNHVLTAVDEDGNSIRCGFTII
jgi:penicillin-binding protein 1C